MFNEEKKRGNLGLWGAVVGIGLYALTASAMVSEAFVRVDHAPASASASATALVAQR